MRNKTILGFLLSALLICGVGHAKPFKVYGTADTVTVPTIAMEINNNINNFNQLLLSFEDVQFYYSPVTHQVFLINTGLTNTYQLEYTFEGNNQYMGVFPYTAVPAGNIQSVPIQLTPGSYYYFTYSGLVNTKFNIDTPNAKYISQDITIFSSTATLNCDLNNQNLSNTPNRNINRILMSCFILYSPKPAAKH